MVRGRAPNDQAAPFTTRRGVGLLGSTGIEPNGVNEVDPTSRRRESLMSQLEIIQRQLDALVDVGDLDSYPPGTIIRAQIKHHASGHPFTYVFLKTETSQHAEQWFSTGRILVATHHKVTTGELLTWLTAPGRVIVSWERLYPASPVDRLTEEPIKNPSYGVPHYDDRA